MEGDACEDAGVCGGWGCCQKAEADKATGDVMTVILIPLLFLTLAGCGWFGTRLVTLRRQLVELRRAFDTLVEKAPVGVVQTNAAGVNVFSNAAWSEISGLSVEETAADWTSIIHPDDRERVLALWEKAVRDQEPYLNELRLVRHDGGERSILASVHPLLDTRGRAGGFIGMVLDFTDLRDVHREVQRREALLQDFIDHSSAAIYLKDTEGRYLLVNKRHAELWPKMREFRPGTTPYDWFPEDIARSFAKTDRRVWETGKTLTFEERVPIGDEARTLLSVKFPLRDDEGKVFAIGGISTDISELDEARRQLSDREQLLRNLIDLQEKERQLICHEFHDGLIQYVVGASMLLERIRDDAGVPEPLVATLDNVISCLTKGLEDARRVIRGIRPASLDDLGLQAAIDDLAGELEQDGVAVEVTIEGGLDRIDEELHTTIYRVIQELLNNATQHSGSPRVTLQVTVGSSDVELIVQDFGCGFDPTQPTEGFGLTGIRERVQLAGGHYDLQSSPGEGTKASIRLPLSTEATDGVLSTATR
jgi:PAS domain S-box-containing protein